MSEQRLIDVHDVYEIIGQTGIARVHVADIDQIKRIDPETLPIVRQLREQMERVTAERDAAIKELDEVTSAVDDLSDFIDEQLHPVVSYDTYLTLRENVDAISIWRYESEWRGAQKEE